MEEIWKECTRNKEYRVSNLGNVFSIKTGKTLKAIRSNGYLHVALCTNGIPKRYNIHVLVAEAFIENSCNKSQVNHIDGNKANNNAINLEWCTPSENGIHAYKTKLWDKQKAYKKVHVRLNDGTTKIFESGEAAANYFGVSKSTITYACNTSGYIMGLPIKYIKGSDDLS